MHLSNGERAEDDKTKQLGTRSQPRTTQPFITYPLDGRLSLRFLRPSKPKADPPFFIHHATCLANHGSILSSTFFLPLRLELELDTIRWLTSICYFTGRHFQPAFNIIVYFLFMHFYFALELDAATKKKPFTAENKNTLWSKRSAQIQTGYTELVFFWRRRCSISYLLVMPSRTAGNSLPSVSVVGMSGTVFALILSFQLVCFFVTAGWWTALFYLSRFFLIVCTCLLSFFVGGRHGG